MVKGKRLGESERSGPGHLLQAESRTAGQLDLQTAQDAARAKYFRNNATELAQCCPRVCFSSVSSFLRNRGLWSLTGRAALCRGPTPESCRTEPCAPMIRASTVTLRGTGTPIQCRSDPMRSHMSRRLRSGQCRTTKPSRLSCSHHTPRGLATTGMAILSRPQRRNARDKPTHKGFQPCPRPRYRPGIGDFYQQCYCL
jgi:hypothetical protein